MQTSCRHLLKNSKKNRITGGNINRYFHMNIKYFRYKIVYALKTWVIYIRIIIFYYVLLLKKVIWHHSNFPLILAKTIDFDPGFGAIGAILAHPDFDRVFCGLHRVHYRWNHGIMSIFVGGIRQIATLLILCKRHHSCQKHRFRSLFRRYWRKSGAPWRWSSDLWSS